MNPRFLPSVAVAPSLLRAHSDTRLTELARAGSEPAFEAIVARYRRSLMRSCAHVIGDADAEEATQDALLKAHAALLNGDPVRRLAPWLHVIAHNTALSYLRARSSRPQVVDYELGAVTDRSAEYREELHEVLEVVRSLPDRQRDAIVMRELEGRSYDEIAARLGSSHGAVRQLLSRARGSVRERLGALVPVAPLVRWAIAGAGGVEATGGATMSGACVLGAKACAAALLPATVALIVSVAPATRHTTVTKAADPAAPVISAHHAGAGTPISVSSRSSSPSPATAGHAEAAARLASAGPSRGARRPMASAGIGATATARGGATATARGGATATARGGGTAAARGGATAAARGGATAAASKPRPQPAVSSPAPASPSSAGALTTPPAQSPPRTPTATVVAATPQSTVRPGVSAGSASAGDTAGGHAQDPRP